MATAAQKRGLAGVSSLRRKLRRMPEDVQDVVKRAILDSAELIKFHQLRKVPVDEGDLAASIEIKLSGDKLSAEIGPGARTMKAKRAAGWRSHLIEFGTRPHSTKPQARLLKGGQKEGEGKGGQHPGMPARPFIRPALKENMDDVTKIIDDAVDWALKKASAGGG